jgi:hypothetical protein
MDGGSSIAVACGERDYEHAMFALPIEATG